jgi:branched-chain amino acid transport system substrate-binding protein
MKQSSVGKRNGWVRPTNWLYLIDLLVLALVISACGGAAAPAPAEVSEATEAPQAAAPTEAVEAEATEAAEVAPTEAPQAEATEEVVAEATEAPAAEAASGEPVLFIVPAELSGAGATVGSNWRDGVELAVEDINAAGGILGRPVEVEVLDTQSDPAISKAVIVKGLEQNPYAVVGPLYSGSIIVNMVETQRAEVTQIMGGEAANLTEQGDPYIFRTSFGQATSMPKLAAYLADNGITSVDVIWINNDFGKGGRDLATKAFEERGIEIVNDISTEQQQTDYASEALTALGSEADALFIYLNEEESARLLAELKKQGIEKPIFGETVLIAQSVIDLAGDAANGAQGHVGLTASAPIPAVEEYAKRFEEKYDYTPDHNGLKGYIAMHVLKEGTERIGEFDTKKLAEALHCTTITTEDEPGVLMDITYNDKGDVDRESFLVEVQDGKQVVTEILSRLGTSCGEK